MNIKLMNENYRCTLYEFSHKTSPWGSILVARVTPIDHDIFDIMIGFPERFMEENPDCTNLISNKAIELIDERSSCY